ncbi:MarR family winged helix-turn-helix transcriptional regulator [Streptomyces xiamenensis]
MGELVERGHVDRTPDPEHGRRNKATLTEEGLRQVRRMDEVLDGVQDDLLTPLSAGERRTLTRLLGRVLVGHETKGEEGR